ncbi:MAG: ribonuclease R [Burkholderiales bacterium]
MKTPKKSVSPRGKKAALLDGGATLRKRDPYLAREQAKYENPLPSREHILDVLRDQGVPLSDTELAAQFGIADAERESFNRRLAAMERDGQLMRNRKNAICLVEKLDLIRGRVQGHPDGFGFLVKDDGGEDLFLNPGEMSKVLHGDRVVARQGGVNQRGRHEGHIVEVLARANRRVVGRFLNEHGIGVVAPEDRRISQDILIPGSSTRSAKSGQVVVAEIVEQPQRHSRPVGRIVEVLGNYADPGMEIEIALRKHDLPHEFPVEAEKLAAKFGAKVQSQDTRDITDLRTLPLVTIDGETAKDFDDAVYCEQRAKGYKLWVAIADVSHYVQDGDALDTEARLRGNSVYFPRRVIPMLPETLSNGLCSLNPDVDRLCMVCEAEIGAKGEIGGYKFYRAVIHSKARLTYTRVAEVLADPASANARALGTLVTSLQSLHALYGALVKARRQRGAIDFETTETQMFFDNRGKIEKIVPTQRNDAHRLIEECMLAANVCASDFLTRNNHPALYRVHEGPTPEKLAALHEFLREFGLHLSGGEAPGAKDYARLLEKVKLRPDVQLLQTVMLRSLRQAVYSPTNVGHFGLAYESYVHFTSPIRRYPDLLVHRSIKAVLEGRVYAPGSWVEIGGHCSETERRADDATRDVESWLKCYYMQDRIGEFFTGTVSGVTNFGVFVALDEVYVEGLVHISELGADYFHFDHAKHQLLGERTGKRFRLGDRLGVKLVRVDLETAKIDFVLGVPRESRN